MTLIEALERIGVVVAGVGGIAGLVALYQARSQKRRTDSETDVNEAEALEKLVTQVAGRQIERLEGEINDLREQMKVYRSEIESRDAKIEHLEEENDKLRKRVDELELIVVPLHVVDHHVEST